MAVVIKGFDFGEDGEYPLRQMFESFPLRRHLTKIAKNISKLSSVDGSGVEEALEELKTTKWCRSFTCCCSGNKHV